MLQQEQNNFRAGLDELSAGAGEATYDTSSAWKKLYPRLEQQPLRRQKFWYRAAASVILAASILFFATRHSKTASADVAKKTVGKETSSPAVFVAPSKETVIFNTLAAADKKKKPPMVLPRIKHDMVFAAPPKKTIAAVPVITVEPEVKIQIQDPVIATAPIKSKLTVVHNNELKDEDRIAAQNSNSIRSARSDTKATVKTGYAGVFNFRIYLKN